MFVYLIVNKTNGKYYVGKTVSKNLNLYFQKKLWDAEHPEKSRGNSHLFNAIRKHGRGNFSVSPLISTLTTNEQLCEWEQFFITLFKSRDPQYGYNICKGGEGFTGEFTPEHRAKIGAAAAAWWSDPTNADAIKARNSKISDDKKQQYASHWETKVCPECGKLFSQPSEFKQVKLCSQACNYQHNIKNNKKWVENRRIVVQSPEYRKNHSKVMSAIGKQQRQASLATYYAHPNYCIQCGSVIKMTDGDKLSIIKKRKFCSRNCSNKRRIPIKLISVGQLV